MNPGLWLFDHVQIRSVDFNLHYIYILVFDLNTTPEN